MKTLCHEISVAETEKTSNWNDQKNPEQIKLKSIGREPIPRSQPNKKTTQTNGKRWKVVNRGGANKGEMGLMHSDKYLRLSISYSPENDRSLK